MTTFEAQTAEQWRRWLARHHASESEVWLIFHKKHTGRPSISYTDALDEALCFGWIDSLVKRLDDNRFARKFTPRQPGSKWSAINRKRYGELKASGRLTPAGVKRPPTNRTYNKPRLDLSTVPAYIEEALRKRPAAWRYFESLAPSYRRHYIGWIETARQEATKRRRLDEATRLLASGQKLGLK